MKLTDLSDRTLESIFRSVKAENEFPHFQIPNRRINAALRSGKHSLLLKEPDPQMIENAYTVSNWIYELILDDKNVDLSRFPNVRHLELLNSTPQQLDQLLSPTPRLNLQYLRIGDIDNCHCLIFPIGQCDCLTNIFSNDFPSLIWCCLAHPRKIDSLSNVTPSPTLMYLEVEFLNLTVYQTILSACPNLKFLKFGFLGPDGTSSQLKTHQNLEDMVIKFAPNLWSTNDCYIEDYLRCVPNLRTLSVYREHEDVGVGIPSRTNYDWFASLIARYLPSLKQFEYHLHIHSTNSSNDDVTRKMLDQMEKDFRSVFGRRYRSKFLSKLDRSATSDE